jgi:hypothetical protein
MEDLDLEYFTNHSIKDQDNTLIAEHILDQLNVEHLKQIWKNIWINNYFMNSKDPLNLYNHLEMKRFYKKILTKWKWHVL